MEEAGQMLDVETFIPLLPTVELNKQDRSRAEIASLYSWRYQDLGNLGHVITAHAYSIAKTGLAHSFQIINVDEFEGRGESTPTAYFYQNMGEAEYAVALLQ